MTIISAQVEALLRQGKTKEEVYITLLSAGASVADLELAFTNQSMPAVASVANQSSTDESSESKGGAVRALIYIGVILIAAGVFSFVASNWQEMSKLVKVLILLMVMLGSYAGAWYAREKSTRTAEGLVYLGTLVFGATLFLVAQMFNIRAQWPDGFILWMIGSMAMAWATSWHGFYRLTAALGAVAIFGYPTDVFDLSGSRILVGDMFTSTLLLLVATVMCFMAGVDLRRTWLAKSQNS